MRARRCLIPLALALFAARCSDQVGPRIAEQQPAAQSLHFLQWAGNAPPRFTASGVLSGQGGQRVRLASPGRLSLGRYTAAFWAVRGEARSIQINYLSSTGDTSAPFLQFTSDDPAYVPGVGDLAPGDSVLITVTIDPTELKVSLEPTGLVFGNPAQLQIWYSGADGDLNGDGVVDDTDAAIEAQLLGLWYREGPADQWTEIAAVHSLADKSFTSALAHFCEYAVSY